MLFVLFLVAPTILASAMVVDPCFSDNTALTYNQLLLRDHNKTWEGAVINFCRPYVHSDDLLLPVSNLTCSGEVDQVLAIVSRTVSVVTAGCGSALSRVFCGYALPKWNATSQEIALPCTSQQHQGNINPNTTLSSFLATSCHNEQQFYAGMEASLFPVAGLLDFLVTTQPSLLQSCDVVDSSEIIVPPVVMSCPQVHVLVTNPAPQEWPCQLMCELPNDSPLGIAHDVLNWYINPIAEILLILTLIIVGMDKKRMVFPQSSIWHMMLGTLVITLLPNMGQIIREIDGVNPVTCVDDHTTADMDHPPCAIVGVIFMYAVKCISYWLTVCFINMYLAVVKNSTLLKRNEKKVFGFCYGMPLFAIVIGLILDIYIPSGHGVCAIDGGPTSQWILIYAELMLNFVVILVVGTLSLLKLREIGLTSFVQTKLRSRHFSYSILLLMVTTLVTIFLSVLTHTLEQADEKDTTAVFQKYFTCIYSHHLSFEDSRCTRPATVPEWAFLLLTISLTVVEFEFFLMFGLRIFKRSFQRDVARKLGPSFHTYTDIVHDSSVSIRSSSRGPLLVWGSQPSATELLYDFVVLGGGLEVSEICRRFVQKGIAGDRIAIVSDQANAPMRPVEIKPSGNPQFWTDYPKYFNDIMTTAWYDRQGISLFLACRVLSVDISSKKINVGKFIFTAKTALILASGSKATEIDEFLQHPPALPTRLMNNVHYLIKPQDLSALWDVVDRKKRMSQKKQSDSFYSETASDSGCSLTGAVKVVVVGGGLRGVECASAISMRGCHVTLVSADETLASSVFTPTMSVEVENLFADSGVVVFKGQRCVGITKHKDNTLTCCLDNEKEILADIIVVCIGTKPNTSLYCDQLKCDSRVAGPPILVGECLETSQQGVFAVGSIATMPFQSHSIRHLSREQFVSDTAKHVVDVLTTATTNDDNSLNLTPSPKFHFHPLLSLFLFGKKVVMIGDQMGDVVVAGTFKTELVALWVCHTRLVGALVFNVNQRDCDVLFRITKDNEEYPFGDMNRIATTNFDGVGLLMEEVRKLRPKK